MRNRKVKIDILEELGVTTSLLDSLQLSIGLALLLAELLSPFGFCGVPHAQTQLAHRGSVNVPIA